MLHNRYHEDYESDFQYYLRREINSSVIKYIPIYITPRGDWFYDEPGGEYILIHVDINSTPGNISKIAASYQSLFTYPF